MYRDQSGHDRHTIRLTAWDYSNSGLYFVTICVQHRLCLFGKIVDDTMLHNDSGKMIASQWLDVPSRFPHVELDAFVVMPNHFHGIIHITSPDRTADPGPSLIPLGTMIGTFKSLTTRIYSEGVHNAGWEPFDRRLWQRNYWEHIIRDQADLDRLREYITTNPARWDRDSLAP